MSRWEDYNVPKIEMVKAERNVHCRGKKSGEGRGVDYCRKKIAIGDTVLRIYMPSTRGYYPSFFCKDCIPDIVNQMHKAIDDVTITFHKETPEEPRLLDFLLRGHK